MSEGNDHFTKGVQQRIERDIEKGKQRQKSYVPELDSERAAKLKAQQERLAEMPDVELKGVDRFSDPQTMSPEERREHEIQVAQNARFLHGESSLSQHERALLGIG